MCAASPSVHGIRLQHRAPVSLNKPKQLRKFAQKQFWLTHSHSVTDLIQRRARQGKINTLLGEN